MLFLPKAIIFDLDNTLYEYEPCHKYAIDAVARHLKEKNKISKITFNKTLKISKKIVKNNLNNTASSHSRILYFQKLSEIILKHTNIKLCVELEDLYWSNFLKKAKLFDDLIVFLKLLKTKKIITGIVTDLTTKIQFKKLIHFKIDNYFDFVVTSEESGYDKPRKTSFNLMLKKLNLPPKQTWMIGDNAVSDMIGAEKVSIFKIQKKHRGVKIIQKGKGKPDLIFENYSQLINILKKELFF